ncbi:hypothetical protein EC973_008559 [Apophysomyces ossiformis]|uniref:BZIP domain-containing protein n=1 Tax=Apophysomyces ossiformis TaxID=679940 RepID=A0A8H7BKZ8_9FUNG|nr:hypothetical protein EC973_008559 [Apophysomyces ossiformis]
MDTSTRIDTSSAKIRKKPGRKPNPASPAQRKAQNREAQRAFRERKERHLRELERSIHQLQEQRDQLQIQNERLQTSNELLRSENWYLKGVVLSLQLVCFQYNLVIPPHTPFIHDKALAVMAQTVGPNPSRAYIHANMRNKLAHDCSIPVNSAVQTTSPSSERYSHDNSVAMEKQERLQEKKQEKIEETEENAEGEESDDDKELITPVMLRPCQPTRPQPSVAAVTAAVNTAAQSSSVLSSNLSLAQTLSFRTRQQFNIPYNNQPTLLQLMIPHDPRIDLIPTPHMRDRMILFRDQFDLDECLQYLRGHAIYLGGDPTLASNWIIPAEFFDNFWFLTSDYGARRRNAANHHRVNKELGSKPCTFSDLSMHFGSELLKFGISTDNASLSSCDIGDTSSLSSDNLDYGM